MAARQAWDGAWITALGVFLTFTRRLRAVVISCCNILHVVCKMRREQLAAATANRRTRRPALTGTGDIVDERPDIDK